MNIEALRERQQRTEPLPPVTFRGSLLPWLVVGPVLLSLGIFAVLLAGPWA